MINKINKKFKKLRPRGGFNLIVIDPPWPIGHITIVPNTRDVSLPYETMPMNIILDLPVHTLAAKKSVIFLWCIQKYLEQGFHCLRKWGFRYQRTLVWDKHKGLCFHGFHHRTEFVLVGVRGNSLKFHTRGVTIPTVFGACSTAHSAKPDEFYTMIEHIGKRRIDVFARKKRKGWVVFGDEV